VAGEASVLSALPRRIAARLTDHRRRRRLAVCTLVVSPWSGELFSRAIIESGPCNGPWQPWSQTASLHNSELFSQSVNASSLRDMRKLKPSALLCNRTSYGKSQGPPACSIDYSGAQPARPPARPPRPSRD